MHVKKSLRTLLAFLVSRLEHLSENYVAGSAAYEVRHSSKKRGKNFHRKGRVLTNRQLKRPECSELSHTTAIWKSPF